LFLVDHIDQLEELGRILDLVLALGKDLAEDALGAGELEQQFGVMRFQISATFGFQALPVVRHRDGQFAAIGRPAELVGHFQEQEVGELFEVVAVADTIIAQSVAEGPNLANDRGGVVGFGGHAVRLYGIILFQRDSLYSPRYQALLRILGPILISARRT